MSLQTQIALFDNHLFYQDFFEESVSYSILAYKFLAKFMQMSHRQQQQILWGLRKFNYDNSTKYLFYWAILEMWVDVVNDDEDIELELVALNDYAAEPEGADLLYATELFAGWPEWCAASLRLRRGTYRLFTRHDWTKHTRKLRRWQLLKFNDEPRRLKNITKLAEIKTRIYKAKTKDEFLIQTYSYRLRYLGQRGALLNFSHPTYLRDSIATVLYAATFAKVKWVQIKCICTHLLYSNSFINSVKTITAALQFIVDFARGAHFFKHTPASISTTQFKLSFSVRAPVQRNSYFTFAKIRFKQKGLVRTFAGLDKKASAFLRLPASTIQWYLDVLVQYSDLPEMSVVQYQQYLNGGTGLTLRLLFAPQKKGLKKPAVHIEQLKTYSKVTKEVKYLGKGFDKYFQKMYLDSVAKQAALLAKLRLRDHMRREFMFLSLTEQELENHLAEHIQSETFAWTDPIKKDLSTIAARFHLRQRRLCKTVQLRTPFGLNSAQFTPYAFHKQLCRSTVFSTQEEDSNLTEQGEFLYMRRLFIRLGSTTKANVLTKRSIALFTHHGTPILLANMRAGCLAERMLGKKRAPKFFHKKILFFYRRNTYLSRFFNNSLFCQIHSLAFLYRFTKYETTDIKLMLQQWFLKYNRIRYKKSVISAESAYIPEVLGFLGKNMILSEQPQKIEFFDFAAELANIQFVQSFLWAIEVYRIFSVLSYCTIL